MVESDKKFQSSLTHRLVRGSAIVLFFSILAAPLGYLVRMLNSRILSIEEFGLFYSILGIYATLNAFNDLGFGYSLNYLVPKFIKNKQLTKAWLAFKYNQMIEVGSSLTISLVLLLTASLLAKHFFKTPLAEDVLKILLIFFIAETFISSLQKFFNGLQEEKSYSSIKPFKMGLTLVISFLLIKLGKGNVLWLATAWSFSHLVTAAFYRLLLHKQHQDLVSPIRLDQPLLKKMWRYALPSLALSSIGLISGSVDNLLLIFFRDLSQVGIYNIVMPLAAISPIFLSPLTQILFPLFSELESEKESLKKVIEASLKIVPYVAFYFGLFIFIFPAPIVQTMFGSKWMHIAEQPLKIAALGFVLMPIGSLLGTVTNGIGLIEEKSKMSFYTLVSKILLSPVAIYFYGVTGAVIANSLIFAISIALLHYYNQRGVNYALPYKTYFLLGLAGLGIYFLSQALQLNPSGYVQIGLWGVAYTAIYVGIGLMINIVDKNTLKLLFKNKRNFRL